jgi:hypothetical protein
MRRPIAAIAVLALLTLAACGGGNNKKDTGAAGTTTTAKAATAPSTVAPGTAPLTGLAADPANLHRPLLIVKIDNAPKARPQAGINQADVVVEEAVEGGVTRFAVMFHSQDADPVGPVRSARTTDIQIATPMHRPLFAYSGTNANFLKLVRAAPLVDLSPDMRPAAYRRQSGRPAPYNLFSATPTLRNGTSGEAPPPLFTYRRSGAAPGTPAASVSLIFTDKVTTSVGWTWDAATGGWRRSEITFKPGSGESTTRTPHLDAAGQQVVAKNVVVQFVEYVDTGERDQSNTAVPEGKLIGEGEAWVLSEGKVVKGRWQRPSVDAVTRFVDAAGQPIEVVPGLTWIELPKPGGATLG